MVEMPVSVGDLIDRIAILEIKRDRITDPAKRTRIRAELSLLTARREAMLAPSAALTAPTREIEGVNRTLWDLEDTLRGMEAAGTFGDAFVTAARAVYRENDERARIKGRIDALTGSALSEQKSYL